MTESPSDTVNTAEKSSMQKMSEVNSVLRDAGINTMSINPEQSILNALLILENFSNMILKT